MVRLRTARAWRRPAPALAGVLVCLAAVAMTAAAARAAVSCRAQVDRTQVSRGEDVSLVVTVEGDTGWSPAFKLPELPGVRVYGGGTNQSMTVTNGQARTVVSRTFYLRVETDTDFTIGPIRIDTTAGACQTDPIAIKVVAGGGPPPADTGNRVARGAGGPPAPAPGGGDDMFVTLAVDKDDVRVGQQVVLSFQYWRRVQPWNNPAYTPPRTEGFWREDLGTERNYREQYHGQTYAVTEIRYALFPTRTGRLQIEPAELAFPEDMFDRFFNSRAQPAGPRVLKTRPVFVQVRDLPSPKPAGFSGIAGTKCEVGATADRTTVARGDAVSLKLTLETDGFLKGFSGLKLAEPEGTRLHDAAENFATVPQGERLLGRLAAEKVLVTTREGTVHVPPLEVVWFDTGHGEYRTARTAAHDVVVTPSDRPLAGGEDSGFLRNEIARVGNDLAFIHVGPLSARRALPAFGGGLWWFLALLPAVLLGGWRWWLARLDADRRDPAGRRRRGALGAARALLRKVGEAAGDVAGGEGGLATVSRAVTTYVGDSLDRPVAAVGSDDVLALAAGRQCPELGRELVALLDACDQARFGGRAGAAAAELAQRALSLLTELDRAAGPAGAGGRRRPDVPSALVVMLLLAGLGAGAGPARAAADAAALVAQGNQAYTDGRFAEARDFYLQARALGVDAAPLHFNLGNAYARTGETGPAVASYLRAQRLAPRDRDVRRNLVWLRQNLKDLELANQSLPLFIAQAAAVVGFLSLDEWGLLLVAALWLLAAAVGWRWAGGPGLWRRRALTVAAALVVVFAAVAGGRWQQERRRDQAVVVASPVAVRSGPAATFPTLFEVHAGLTLNVEGQRDGWAKVSLGGNWQGWLPADAVEHVRLPRGATGPGQGPGR